MYQWKETFTRSFAKFSQSPTPTVLSLIEKNGRMGQDIEKGVYYAFVLTIWNFANFKYLSRTKQRECPVGVLYTYLKMPHSHWYIPTPLAHKGIEVVLYISAWGYALLVSTGRAMRRPQIVKRATVQGFTLFLCLNFPSCYKIQGCRSPEPEKHAVTTWVQNFSTMDWAIRFSTNWKALHRKWQPSTAFWPS